MDKLALLALLQAKPGKEKEVEDFLKSARPLALQETGTTTWYAVKLGPAKFGIFDTFADENGQKRSFDRGNCKATLRQSRGPFCSASASRKTRNPGCESSATLVSQRDQFSDVSFQRAPSHDGPELSFHHDTIFRDR